MWSRNFVIFLLFFIGKNNCAVNKTEAEPRFVPPPPPFAPPLLYPVNAATGILVAIAVPVPLPDQNVFVSYNFEGNYNMPNVPADSFPGKIDRWTIQNNTPFPILYGPPAVVQGGTADDIIARKLETESEDEVKSNATETETAHEVTKRNTNDRGIFTRRGAYKVIESRLNAYGMNGKKCLLLAICDSSRSTFSDHNGVIGHVLHIILTPSSSANEKLPAEYAKAETLGKSGNCKKYQKHCPFNVLDAFSKMF